VTPRAAAQSASEPDGPDDLGRDVVRIRGSLLRGHLRELPSVLDGETIRRIAESLDAYGEQLDEAVGIPARRWRR
jgi:hypothetical protein